MKYFLILLYFKTVLLLNIDRLTLDSAGNLNELISVETRSGKVIGKRVQLPTIDPLTEQYVNKYLGIPYAQPPIGDLRFKPPVEVQPWTEPRETLDLPNSCIQSERYPDELSISEDCLYLNVIVPDPIPTNATVMVYIYGGGFTMGSVNYINFDRLVVQQRVIVVAMNYRLGSFGFLYLDNEECPGNMGLRDQNMALKWVHDNVDRFGGDPGSVTVFGHSAGSISTGHHLLNPHYQDLFRRVILQSGSPFSLYGVDSKMKALHKSAQVASVAGCSEVLGNLKATAACLRKVNASEILFASKSLDTAHFPVIDNKYAFGPHSLLIHNRDKQVMLGVNSNDGGFVVNSLLKRKTSSPTHIFQNVIKTFMPHLRPQVIDLVKYFYKDHCNQHPEFKEEIATVRLVTDIVFTCSTNGLADALSKHGVRTYMYQFKHKPRTSTKPVWIGADHTDEFQFVFGQLSANANDHEKRLSELLMNYWGNFAKYGNPNAKTELDDQDSEEQIEVYDSEQNGTEFTIAENWPRYTVEEKGRLDIDLLATQKAFGALQADQCSFWNHVYPLFSLL